MRPPTATFMAFLAALALAPGAAAHALDTTDHAHAEVTLDGGTLRYEFTGALQVVAGSAGPEVRVVLPPGASAVSFQWDNHPNGTLGTDTSPEGVRHAVYRWNGTGPAAGELVENATMIAERPFEALGEFSILWGPLAPNLTVSADLPDDYVAVGDGFIELAHTAPGRRVWHDVNHGNDTLTFSIRPLPTGQDPALSAPPWPIGGFLVLLVLALLSAGAWIGTKKLESYLERQKER